MLLGRGGERVDVGRAVEHRQRLALGGATHGPHEVREARGRRDQEHARRLGARDTEGVRLAGRQVRPLARPQHPLSGGAVQRDLALEDEEALSIALVDVRRRHVAGGREGLDQRVRTVGVLRERRGCASARR